MLSYLLLYAIAILGWAIGYLLIPVLIAFGLYKLIGSDWFGRIKRRRLVGVIAALCVPLAWTYDIVPGNRYFAKLCEAEAGLEIHRTAEGVEGLALTAKKREIRVIMELVLLDAIKSYGFVEQEIGAKSIPHVDWKPPSGQPGIYKYSFARQGAPGCDVQQTNRLSAWIPQDHCLAIERVPEFSARYAHESGWNRFLPYEVKKFEQRVFDLRSGETLATWRRLVREPNWSWNGLSRFFDPETECPKRAMPALGLDSLDRVLIPAGVAEPGG